MSLGTRAICVYIYAVYIYIYMLRYADLLYFLCYGAKRALLRVCAKMRIVPTRPDPTRPDPTRPDPNLTLIECLYLGKYQSYEKKYQTIKLDPDHKIFVLKFDIDIFNSLAATTGFAKCYFCSFSPISL